MSTDAQPRGAPRVLLTCVSEDRPDFHENVERLVSSARRLGGSLRSSPVLVNMVGGADRAFVERMRALDAEVRIVAPVPAGGALQANKLRMFELEGREDFDVLLAVDCDVAVAGDPVTLLWREAVSVVPADKDPFSDEVWRAIFEGLRMAPLDRSLHATTTGEAMYEYFNSGVIGVPRELCAALFDGWMQAIEDLDELWSKQPQITSPRTLFYTDQLAFAVVLGRGLPWRESSRELNFPTHVDLHMPTVQGLRPALLHHHSEIDERGFLYRPQCPVAEGAAERVNRARALALGVPYEALADSPAPPRPMPSRPLRTGARRLVGRLATIGGKVGNSSDAR